MSDAEDKRTADLSELRRLLHRAVARLCPARLADHVEDIVQTGILRVAQIQRESGEDLAFSASYMKKVAYTAVVDEIRRHDRRSEVPLEDPDAQPSPAPFGDAVIAAEASGEIRDALSGCLGMLDVSRRRAVVLYLLGHTVPEAGRIMGWTTRKTEHLVYRGLADLRRCLSSKGIQP